MADLLTTLRDVNTPQSRLVQSVATGAFTTFVSPARMSPRSRTTMHALSGLVGAGAGAFALAGKMPAAQRTAAALVLGGTLYGASALGVAADVKAEQWLRGRGVRRPRVVLGVLAGVLTWLTSRPTESLDSLDQGGGEAEDAPEAEADSR